MKTLVCILTILYSLSALATEKNCSPKDAPGYVDMLQPIVDERDNSVVWHSSGIEAYKRFIEVKNYEETEEDGEIFRSNGSNEYCKKFVIKEKRCGMYECYKK